MVLSATSTICQFYRRRSVLVEETGRLGENQRPVASHWQTLSHNVANLALIEIRTHISGESTDFIGSYKSNYHTITTTSWDDRNKIRKEM
jgi:hypothetical protein